MGCYNFRMLNGSPRVTSKKVAIEYTQKEMRKKFKHFILKSTKTEDSNEEQKSYRSYRRQRAQ